MIQQNTSNINYHQMVLASGEIIKVTRTSYPDLYWAMRGAGKNFGIVTSFEFEAFEQGQMWGGSIQYPGEQEDAVLEALDKYNRISTDEYAEAFVMSTYVSQIGAYVETAFLSHGKPENDPPIFNDFKVLPQISSATRQLSLTELASDLEVINQPGFR